MRLVHLTDPHMSSLDGEKFSKLRGKRWSGYLSWKKNRRKKFLPAVLDKLTVAIQAENADQVLLTGDLIQIGLENEVAQAAAWLQRLGSAGQIMLVPGNHDVYAKDSADFIHQSWSRYLFHDIDSGKTGNADSFPVVRKLDKLSLIGLNSACVTPTFSATGTLGEDQLSRLTGLLRQAADEGQLVCLLIHHPPLPGMTNWRKGLTDVDDLEAVLAQYPPTLIFHGHLHHNRELQWGDSRVYCTAAASSISESSYRVIDIEYGDDAWSFRTALKSIAVDDEGELEFVSVDEQVWQIPKDAG